MSEAARALVWFRSDLRIRDNTALHQAARDCKNGIVAVFTVCPEQWREHDWADIKVEFLRQNLLELSEALASRNTPLKIVSVPLFDAVPEALWKLARRTSCDRLYFNDEYEVNESRRDRAVQRLFEGRGKTVLRFTDQVALEPGSVKTKQGEWYSVFTPFKRSWAERWVELGRPPVPVIRRQPATGVSSDSIGKIPGFDADAGRPDLWPAGEKAARARLSKFVERRIKGYHKDRDLPAVAGTSTLSPYLAIGVISPRQCLAAALDANKNRVLGGAEGISTWISELIWREFYKHLLVGFPRLSMNRPFRLQTEGLEWNHDKKAFAAWCEGRTGFPIVDAAMRQLGRTGWMHNRLRMVTAMFLTKDLLIDWRWGERHFMRRLVDGDLAANNGGWQWSASTGTDAAPYFRIFNPTSQSKRYDTDGEFIRRFVPELAGLGRKAIHDPSPEERERCGYPAPMCDHSVARQNALAVWKRL